MLKHIYFYTTVSVGYTVEIPDGMDEWQVAHELNESVTFYVEKLGPDIAQADSSETDYDIDDCVNADFVDITAEQVLDWAKRR